MVDIEGLNQFIAIAGINRDISLFFSGREDVLSRLTNRASLANQIVYDHGRTPSGFTTIVQGCPGIGKTSLMHRFVQLCDEDFESNGRNGSMPLPIILGLSEARDLESIMERTIGPDPSNLAMRWMTELGKEISDQVRLSTTLENFLDALKPYIGRRAIVVLVDEIQNADDLNRQFLTNIHNGIDHGKTVILPVYFGLNDSEFQLTSLGLSRLGDDAIVNLGLLKKDDCRQSFHAMLDKYRVKRTDVTDEWIEVMVEDSQYFPHHLTVSLRATASHLVQNNGNLSKEGLEAAREQALTWRKRFYENRVGDSLLTPREVIGEIARSLQSDHSFLGSSRLEASSALIEIAKSIKGLPVDADRALEMADAMIHQGILQIDPNTKTYTISIPSFQTWAADELVVHSPRV